MNENSAVNSENSDYLVFPDQAEGYRILSHDLYKRGNIPLMMGALRRAFLITHDYVVEDLHSLVMFFYTLKDYDNVVTLWKIILLFCPHWEAGWHDLGVTLNKLCRFQEAQYYIIRAIHIHCEQAEFHCNLAQSLLHLGQWRKGLEEYEWRWKHESMLFQKRDFFVPKWQGQRGQGQKLFIHKEGGFGDTLQYCRFIHSVEKLGWHCIYEVQEELHSFIQHSFPEIEICLSENEVSSFDQWCSSGSLPYLLDTEILTIPDIPYLKTTEAGIRKWSNFLSHFGQVAKVGLVWAGSDLDKSRSIPLHFLNPLFYNKEILFFNLQVGEKSLSKDEVNLSVDLPSDLKNFQDMADLVSCLDLVITVDTAMAHLAGGLGKTVWLLLPFACNWRWFHDRVDSPWYPSMQLFRQSKNGEWPDVIKRVCLSLNSRYS